MSDTDDAATLAEIKDSMGEYKGDPGSAAETITVLIGIAERALARVPPVAAETQDCPKCGGTIRPPVFCSGEYPRCTHSSQGWATDHEHLTHVCSVCGYTSTGPCNDAEVGDD